MAIGKTNAGGGGTSLNFDVKRYSTEAELLAATPKKYTIGIISTTEITSWGFYATKPDTPDEGMVWISVGTSSSVEFNALKKNGIQVCPISAKQYVGGAWVDKTAKSYQNGAWVDWIYPIVSSGTVISNRLDGRLRSASAFMIDQNAGYIRVTTTSETSDGFAPSEPIDVSERTQVVLKCKIIHIATSSSNNGIGVGLSSGLNATSYAEMVKNIVAKTSTLQTGEQTLICDISEFEGLYYPCFYADANYNDFPDMYVYDFYVK